MRLLFPSVQLLRGSARNEALTKNEATSRRFRRQKRPRIAASLNEDLRALFLVDRLGVNVVCPFSRRKHKCLVCVEQSAVELDLVDPASVEKLSG